MNDKPRLFYQRHIVETLQEYIAEVDFWRFMPVYHYGGMLSRENKGDKIKAI
jgi:hypothetical protein